MRSPSTIVGFIEPVGTSFQSATAERRKLITTITVTSGKTHSRKMLPEPRAGPSGTTPFSGLCVA